MAVGRAYKPLLDGLGITYPLYLVLSALWERDRLSVGATADRLSLESSTITPLVKRLAVSGFVGRERNPENERQVIVRLTDAGRALRERSACLGDRLLAATGMTVGRLRRLNAELRATWEAVAEHNGSLQRRKG